jgi:hypothetical protein
MSIMKRRTLLALVAIAVVLFGLTLNSCKDCNSGKNRGKGKDLSGGGSSTGNSSSGSSAGNSGNGSSTGNLGKGKDPLGSRSFTDNSNSESSIGNLGSGSSADPLGDGNSTDNSNSESSAGNSKDPSGGGSSADPLGDGNSTDNSNSESSADNSKDPSGGGSSADNSASPPKKIRVLTLAEQEELDRLKAQLAAAAKVIIMNNDENHKSQNMEVKDMTYNYRKIRYDDVAAEKKWFSCLYWMCLYREHWANYLKEKCDEGNIPPEDDSVDINDKWLANIHKDMAESLELEGKAAAAKCEGINWGKLKPLLEPAKRDWDSLLAAEEAYRDALRKYEVI